MPNIFLISSCKKTKRNWLKYLIAISVCLVIISCKRDSSKIIDGSLSGCWELKEAYKLHDTSEITSVELLQDVREFNTALNSLLGSEISFFDSFFTADNRLKGTPLGMDTVSIIGLARYKRMSDTKLTLKYPGDELSDTTYANRQVGRTFMSLIGCDSINLSVLLAKNNQSEYRICIIDNSRIAILSLDQNVLLKFSKCYNR